MTFDLLVCVKLCQWMKGVDMQVQATFVTQNTISTDLLSLKIMMVESFP